MGDEKIGIRQEQKAGNRWGMKIAASGRIVFDRVPANALLWLRNHTKGVEEQVFWMEDGKQVFLAGASVTITYEISTCDLYSPGNCCPNSRNGEAHVIGF